MDKCGSGAWCGCFSMGPKPEVLGRAENIRVERGARIGAALTMVKGAWGCLGYDRKEHGAMLQ